MAALAVGVLVLGLLALGHVTARLRGGGFWTNLVPFTAVVLLLGVGLTSLARGWLHVRAWVGRHAAPLPALTMAAVALALVGVAFGSRWGGAIGTLRRITDAPAQAQREAIEHQVYAAYRRTNLGATAAMFERARAYEAAIREAARAFDVSPEVLMGIAASESSFLPRDSADGGRGLFQITAAPKTAVAAVRDHLGGRDPDVRDDRHNALLGAATLRVYVDEMRGDPFLALLAYNIGPQNGGLRSIMRQYGATDFVTIQPYLKDLPRDYPIRVLSAALAYRVWKAEAALPPYQDGANASRIQAIGVPGLGGDLAG
jgi:soluble lytic murein transglycosylase-like protein